MEAALRSASAEAALRRVDRTRLVEILRALVDVPSPTGEEAPLARAIAASLTESGLEGAVQALGASQANAVGRIPGRGTGPSLLLYAPIDTVTSNNAAEDLPWVGPTLRPDMRAHSYVQGEHVFGLGAHNPKGHAACIIAAAEAIRAAGTELEGALLLGFGAGGMPTHARRGMPPDSGHGVGCAHLLRTGPKPDFALIAKSGWSVSWEEVGFCWFEVGVKGTHTYVGSRHLLPYRNAILDAGRLIERLEQWFPHWTEDHRSGLVAPQGVVSYIEGGWSRMPAFTPAICRFRVDLRVSPRTSCAEARARFGELLEAFRDELDIDIEWSCIAEIPGTSTPPDNWIIRSAVAGWETLEKRTHRPVAGLSGATDANILRGAGIPTARIGLPKARLADIDFQLGMNAVDILDLERLTRHLILVAIDTCARTREEING